MEIIIESERDRRTLEWLVSEVGLSAVEEAAQRLAGRRKLYVSNISKVLGLTPPESVLRPSKEEARALISEIKMQLRRPRK